MQLLSPRVQEQPPENSSREIKDVNMDNRLEKTAQREHSDQRLKHDQLKKQCVFICYRRGVRSAAKVGAGGAPIQRRSWQTYEWQKVSQTHVIPPLCLFFFLSETWVGSNLFFLPGRYPAETRWQIQM